MTQKNIFGVFLYPLLDVHSLKVSVHDPRYTRGKILNSKLKKSSSFSRKKHDVHSLEFGYECFLLHITKNLMKCSSWLLSLSYFLKTLLYLKDIFTHTRQVITCPHFLDSKEDLNRAYKKSVEEAGVNLEKFSHFSCHELKHWAALFSH